MALSGQYTISELAELFEVSRPTVYLYRDRYREKGREGLADRSRARHTIQRVSETVRARVIGERVRFGFGAKKIRRRMFDDDPDGSWPARSTIESILSAEGLVHTRQRRPKYASPFRQRFEAAQPGEVQAIDFKGQFRLRDGRWCYPLTMSDSFSRYVLACEALPSISLKLAWPIVERVFRENGLPDAVLSDNGSPFGAHGLGRFSVFGMRLMELGIQPILIDPGRPEQNGRHERMHRSLLESPLFERALNFRRQQRIFDAFKDVYNNERPHEGINLDRPAKRHRPSPRPYPERLPPLDYPAGFQVRRIDSNGSLHWRNQSTQVSKVFAGRPVGLHLIDDARWDVYFGAFLIGRFDERERRFV
jgi:transposase InsO family protein